MLKNVLTFLICVSLATVGCQDSNKETEAQLVAEVMKIHDNCMPKLADINALKRQIKSYKAILPESDALHPKLLETLLSLSKAEDGMMDWMVQWGDYRSSEHSHEDLKAFYTQQKTVIQGVSDSIFMSIAQAKGLLANAPDSLKAQ